MERVGVLKRFEKNLENLENALFTPESMIPDSFYLTSIVIVVLVAYLIVAPIVVVVAWAIGFVVFWIVLKVRERWRLAPMEPEFTKLEEGDDDE